MKPNIPVHLNFMQKANNGCEIQGKWPIKQLKRVSDILLSEQGEINIELKFDRAGRNPFIEGHISADLKLKCQRCMQAMDFPLDSHFKLGLVLNEAQMDELPDIYEPYLVEDENNHLPDMIEDELLLALPLVPMHEFDCSEYVNTLNSEQPTEEVKQEKKENPFSVLKDLL